MDLIKNVPTIAWIGVAFALLAIWVHDVRGLYIAGVCLVISVAQATRDS